MDSNTPDTYVARPRHKTFFNLLVALCIMAFLNGTAWAEMVNLNSADAEALEYIPGIGPSKASRIIAEREASNGFKTAEDLLSVPGIGAKTLELILQHGAIDSGVSTLTDEMRNNPPKLSRKNSADTDNNTSG